MNCIISKARDKNDGHSCNVGHFKEQLEEEEKQSVIEVRSNTCGIYFCASPINIKKHRKASLYAINMDSILEL